MSTVFHTPHATEADLSSLEVNRPISELDAAINTVIAAMSDVSNPNAEIILARGGLASLAARLDTFMESIGMDFDADGNLNVSLATALSAALDSVGTAVWNGAAYEAQQGTVESTLLASLARTTTGTSADQTNRNGAGVALFLKVTAEANAGDSLSVLIQGKDPTSGAYYQIATSGALYTRDSDVPADTPKAFIWYPGVLAADFVGSGDLGTVGKSGVLPRTWRAVVLPALLGDGGSWTYSLGASLLP